MEALKGKILKCKICGNLKEGIKLKSYNLKICFDCFVKFFENRVEKTIKEFKMFNKEDKIAVAISGGKDSVALAKALKNLGYNITLFHINTSIKEKNYGENSLKIVEEFAKRENLPLKILNLEDEIGTDIKIAARIAKKEICAVCGMVKRYLLNKNAKDFDVIATGHTLDDEAGNLLNSLIFRKEEFLNRQEIVLKERNGLKRKVKPLAFCFEKDTKLYCQILNLPYIETPCPLRGGSYVVFKEIVHKLEDEFPSSIIAFYKYFIKRKGLLNIKKEPPHLSPCKNCGYLTINNICSFCNLKEKIKKFLKQNSE